MVRSFPPLTSHAPRVLILGTMPGEASLRAARYYEHPRNAFWPIALALAGRTRPDRTATLALPYAERVRRLVDAGIAVWDVLAECERHGSLDSAIRRDTLQPNALDRFVAQHATLHTIAFNGRKAETLFRQHVRERVDTAAADRALTYRSLPSTSPAMASLSLDAKFSRWHEALAERLGDATTPPVTGVRRAPGADSR